MADSMEDEKVQLRKAKIDFVVSIVTLVTVLIGLVSTTIFYVSQKSEIEKLREGLRDLHSLRAALTMPLEGIWEYRVEYTKYFEEEMHPGQKGSKYMKGKAHVLWNPPANDNYWYTVYIGAALYATDAPLIPIVTAFSENKIITDSSGIPKDGFVMTGEYLARTSADSKYANPTQKTFQYDGGKIERGPTGQIQTVVFDFKTAKSTGKIIFTRQ